MFHKKSNQNKNLLNKLRSKFTSNELSLIKKAYNHDIKKIMPYYHYLIFLDLNAVKIRSILRKFSKQQKKKGKLRGGFLSLILGAIAAISAAATTAAPVIASAVSAAAPIVAGAGLAATTEIIVQKIAEK